ncbi:MAG: carbon storage regulator [Gammaproteobacteria bacterium]|nr:carbon storage regulator [Gammaproteobacteria bacterium]MDH4313234.1 carbon storage regulator [Gammaproteobacteria bacterium]MDH5213560.1 carbon storage regulator [Gammaproteobacteria bacterium]
MLIVSRRDAESILIRPGENIDPKMTLADLFKSGPIEITIFSSGTNRVKMGVQAPAQLSIWRKNAATAA